MNMGFKCRVRMTNQKSKIKMKTKVTIKMKRAVSPKSLHANVARPKLKEQRKQKKKERYAC